MYRLITRRKHIKNRRTRRKRGGGVFSFLKRCRGIGCTKIKHGNVVEPVAEPPLKHMNLKKNLGGHANILNLRGKNVVKPVAEPQIGPNESNNTAIPKILTFKSDLAIQARIRKGYRIKYALIACHPRKVSRLDDHWIFKEKVWGMLIEKIEPYDFLVIDTVDTSERGGQDIDADIFDPKFIDKYKYKYDLVCIPDCDGEWAKLQIKNPGVDDIWAFVKMALPLLYLAGAGGIICYSKFLEIDKIVDTETGNLVDYVNHDEPYFKSPYYSELKRTIESYKYHVSWTGPPNITLIVTVPK